MTVTGALAPRPPLQLPAAVRSQCGASAVDLSVQVGSDGALANAVVFVADAPREPLPEGFAPPLLDQHQCRYEPPLVVTRTGATLQVRNSDALLHNVRIERAFNVAMPLEGQVVRKRLGDTAGPFAVRCDVHPWMRADLYLLPHGQYAVTGPDGRFRLEHVEAGARPLGVWHARWPARTLQVEVSAERDAALDVSFEAALLLQRSQ